MNERDALMRAICENPDDDTPRLVFADWLQEHGEDDRAEFIRAQVRLELGEENAALRERTKLLLTEYGEEWSEPVRAVGASLVSYRKPTPQSINGIEFRRGFPYGVQIDEGNAGFADCAADLFRTVPVQRISFYHQWGYTKLAACSELLRLKEISLDRSGYETEELSVFFGSKYLKRLERLELIADDDNGHLTAAGLELVSKTRGLPALRHLDLSFNWCEWFASDGADWVRALLKGSLVARLESLWLRSTFLGDGGAEALARSKRFRSLRHLNLSGNSIGERGLRALVASPHIQSDTLLDLRENRYDPDDGPEVVGCTSEVRQLLEARFGDRMLLDGKAEPHPLP